MKDNFSAKVITLHEIYENSYKLAKIITQSPYKFDIVVAIARGGFPTARFICDFLNIRQLCSMQIVHYRGGAVKKEKTEIISPINISVKEKNILIVDDVNDTGETLKAAYDHIQSLEPALFKIAVLHEKSTTLFKADFVASHQKKWKWLTYQWAVTEDIISFLEKDNMLGEDEALAREHLYKKYKIKISKKAFQQILGMQGNYL